jgi:lipoprotein-releasing system permease protein
VNLPVELFLALRYLRPRRTFVSVITVLSVFGVMLGVMVLIVVLSVMEGFEQRLQEKIIGFNAHLTVGNGGVLNRPQDLAAELKRDKRVRLVTPYAQGPVLAQFDGRISTPVLRGVPVDGDDAAQSLRRYIVSGVYELRGDSVLVGEEWARRHAALVGDKILVYAPKNIESLRDFQKQKNGAIFLPAEMTIAGIFSTGLFDYDLNFLVTSLENVQRLYRLEDGAHGLAVRVDDPMAAAGLAAQWNKLWQREGRGTVRARTWMDQNRPLFNAIATERVVMSFILFFIMIVAAFGLCSTLITITVQKSREIGVLKALGARQRQIGAVFALHGLIVGVIGAAGGVALGLLALEYRNPFRHLLDDVFGLNVFSADIYNFAEIPAVVVPQTVLSIALAAVAICVLAALIPARSAARLHPAQALRYE